MTLKKKLQNRQSGFIVSAELALITTILVIGLVVGLVAMRDAMVAEMHDFAEAIGELDQSYAYQGLVDPGTGAVTQGSSFIDLDDRFGATAGVNQGGAGLGGDDQGLLFVANDGDELGGLAVATPTP